MYFFTFQHTYKHPWELVTHTHLTKYPTTKEKNVLGSEITRSSRGSDNTVYIKMIVTCLNVLPSVFRKWKVLDIPHILYEEECFINIEKRSMTVKSQPLAFQDYALMNESSVFVPDSQHPEWTLFKQEGTVEMRGFGRMNWLIERFSNTFLSRGARRNVIIMEELMEERMAAFRKLR